MQRSWLAPSRICFNILAFSQGQTPTLSLLQRNAGSNQPDTSASLELVTGSSRAGASQSLPAHTGPGHCLLPFLVAKHGQVELCVNVNMICFPRPKMHQCQLLTLPSTRKHLEDIKLIKLDINCY